MSRQLSLPLQTAAELESIEVAKVFDDAERVRAYAPSLFATHAHPNRSTKYAFTNTYEIVQQLHVRGFRVVSVQGGSSNYNKVLVRMRSPDYGEVDGVIPELAILDSHDGTSLLKMLLGALSVACLNGMLAGNAIFMRKYVHYRRDLMAQVLLDVHEIEEAIHKLRAAISAMRKFQTTFGERIIIADKAIRLRWGESMDGSFVADLRQKMLAIRRIDDNSEDLYTVLNVVQENIMRGGASYNVNDRIQSVRPITAVNRNVMINQNIWNIGTEIMQQRAA